MSEFNRHLDDSPFRQRCSGGRLDRIKAHAFPANFCLFLLIAFALALAPTAARSQELEGTFTGTVTDSTGALIPHATVTITLNGSGQSALSKPTTRATSQPQTCPPEPIRFKSRLPTSKPSPIKMSCSMSHRGAPSMPL